MKNILKHKPKVTEFNRRFMLIYGKLSHKAMYEQYKTAFNACYGKDSFKDYYFRDYVQEVSVAWSDKTVNEYTLKNRTGYEHGVRLPKNTGDTSCYDTLAKMNLEV